MKVGISDYLDGRRCNRQLLNRIAHSSGLNNAIDKFNESAEREIQAEWSMSAKYQTLTLHVSMTDGDSLSMTAKTFIWDEIDEIASEWFGTGVDDEDIRSTWASIDLGL